MPEFNMILVRKIITIPEFLIFAGEINKIPNCAKNARILHKNCPIFFGGGWWGTCPLPASPTPMDKR